MAARALGRWFRCSAVCLVLCVPALATTHWTADPRPGLYAALALFGIAVSAPMIASWAIPSAKGPLVAIDFVGGRRVRVSHEIVVEGVGVYAGREQTKAFNLGMTLAVSAPGLPPFAISRALFGRRRVRADAETRRALAEIDALRRAIDELFQKRDVRALASDARELVATARANVAVERQSEILETLARIADAFEREP